MLLWVLLWASGTAAVGAACSRRATLEATGVVQSFADGSGVGDYADDVNCAWHLVGGGGSAALEMRFTRLALAPLDFVYVYDADSTQKRAPLLTLTGADKAPEGWIKSSGNSLLVQFVTDREGGAAGFNVEYQLARCLSGTWSLTGREPCVGSPCSAGGYGPVGATSELAATCRECPVGTTTFRAGRDKCSACTGESAGLDARECAAWQEGYDAMGGSTWAHCKDKRSDPCACDDESRTVKCRGGHITSVSLFSNGMQGELPAAWSAFSRLQHVRLQNNKLHGPLPHAWADLAKLETMMLFSNRLSGRLPMRWGTQLSSLSQIWLEDNNLEGPMPVSWNSMPQSRVTALWSSTGLDTKTY
eukprot:g7913.t1